MKPIFFGLIVLGALFIYEAVKSMGPPTHANVTTGAPKTQDNTGTGPLLGGLPLPLNWIQGLAKSEGASFPGTAFGISDPNGVGPGNGVGGTNIYHSGAASGCQACPDGAACCTPPMQEFQNLQQAVQGLARVLGQPRYAPAFSYYDSHPQDCNGFFTLLGQLGYSGPSDPNSWAAGVCSLAAA